MHYGISITNQGYSPIDLSQLSGNTIIGELYIDFLPPELTFISNNNPDITCVDTGPLYASLIASAHADSNAIVCNYTGGSYSLHEGESITDTINVSVNNNSDLVFTNYALASTSESDPDHSTIISAFSTSLGGGGTPDFLDTLVDSKPNNFGFNTYPQPIENSDQHNRTNSGSNGGLSSTGQSIVVLLSLSVLMVIGGVLIASLKRIKLRQYIVKK